MNGSKPNEAGIPDGEDTPEIFNILRALESSKGLMNVDQVAKLLGRSRDVIYRMARRQQIPVLRIGAGWKFDPSALAFWLNKKDRTLSAAARCHFRAA